MDSNKAGDEFTNERFPWVKLAIDRRAGEGYWEYWMFKEGWRKVESDKVEKAPCSKCMRHESMHDDVGRRLCCQCHIEEGHAPADWHTECMKSYRGLRQRVKRVTSAY